MITAEDLARALAKTAAPLEDYIDVRDGHGDVVIDGAFNLYRAARLLNRLERLRRRDAVRWITSEHRRPLLSWQRAVLERLMVDPGAFVTVPAIPTKIRGRLMGMVIVDDLEEKEEGDRPEGNSG